MYFPDLSPNDFGNAYIGYEYERFGTVNVGWLDKKHTYVQGKTSDEFQTRLLEFCAYPVVRTRGFHECEFCESSISQPICVQMGDRKIGLGSAEIRVFYNGRVYAAPNLIYHYVVEHQYKPPDEFIEAVLQGSLPNSLAYKTLIDKMSIFLEG